MTMSSEELLALSIRRARLARRTPRTVPERPRLPMTTPEIKMEIAMPPPPPPPPPPRPLVVAPLRDEVVSVVVELPKVELWLRPALSPLSEQEETALREALESRTRFKEIIQAVSTICGIPLVDLLSIRRPAAVSRARQICFYLGKKHTRMSLPQIGRRFGGKDHTTVLHGIRRITELRTVDPDLDAKITLIETKLKLRAAVQVEVAS